jgi:hypothetical protein
VPSLPGRGAGCVHASMTAEASVLSPYNLERRRRRVAADHHMDRPRLYEVNFTGLGGPDPVRPAIIAGERRRAAQPHVQVRIAGAGKRERVSTRRKRWRRPLPGRALRHGAAVIQTRPGSGIGRAKDVVLLAEQDATGSLPVPSPETKRPAPCSSSRRTRCRR